MRLTIIPSDGAVYKDNYYFSKLDLSSVPTNVHALQWYEAEGEVEFNGEPKPQNEIIFKLPVWAEDCLTKWNEAKAVEEAAILAAKEAIANQPKTKGTQTA